MVAALLLFSPNPQLPDTVVVALVVVVVVSVLALAVSVRIARRMRAIGDLGQVHDDEPSPPEDR
jgi:hypothetical protein